GLSAAGRVRGCRCCAAADKRYSLALMCTLTEIVASALMLLLVIGGGVGLWFESKFMSRLSAEHPAEWRELSARGKKVLFADRASDMSYIGAQWYLILRGEYKKIEDDQLRVLGSNARLATLVTLGIFAVLGVLVVATQASPSLACMLPRT
ncbi:hypothetical protein, partial [Ramlibacter monticola]